MLRTSRFKIVVVLHANHPNELSPGVFKACKALRDAQCTLLNQSVLLSGVNDTLACLVKLSERLWTCDVLPYYLHVLDKVAGAAHFDVSIASAKSLLNQLRAQLPGYLVPRLVSEQPGLKNKQPVP